MEDTLGAITGTPSVRNSRNDGSEDETMKELDFNWVPDDETLTWWTFQVGEEYHGSAYQSRGDGSFCAIINNVGSRDHESIDAAKIYVEQFVKNDIQDRIEKYNRFIRTYDV
jgi:hypothetical protein